MTTKTTNKRLKKLMVAELQDWRITTRLYPYLTNHPNDAGFAQTPEMAKIIARLLTARQADRSGAFHPSQLYTCERAQMFGYLNFPAKQKAWTPETINLFMDGHYRHVKWQVILLQAGIITAAEVPVSVPGYRFSGSMDGVNDKEHWMLEIKGTSQFDAIKSSNTALPAHVKQVHGYLLARPDLEETAILYEDKSTNHWHEIIVRRNKTYLREVEGILNALNEALSNKKLPQVLPECKRGEGQYTRCPYAYACKQVDFGQAQAAQACADAEEVIVQLGLKRRNTHEPADGGAPKSGQGRSGTPLSVRTPSGTIRLRRGATR